MTKKSQVIFTSNYKLDWAIYFLRLTLTFAKSLSIFKYKELLYAIIYLEGNLYVTTKNIITLIKSGYYNIRTYFSFKNIVIKYRIFCENEEEFLNKNRSIIQ